MKQICDSDIKDISLSDDGLKRVEWAWKEMRVLQELATRFVDAIKPGSGSN